MKGAFQSNPGNVNVRFGAACQMYEDAVGLRDLEGAADALSLMADYVSVFMSEAQWTAFDGMPGFAYDDREHHEVFRDLSARRRVILRIAKSAGVFARKDEVPVTDGDLGDAEEVAA